MGRGPAVRRYMLHDDRAYRKKIAQMVVTNCSNNNADLCATNYSNTVVSRGTQTPMTL